MGSTDMDMIKDIPGYKVILKAVLKHQIQVLVDQLACHTDEESVILTASTSDGSLSHLGSEMGKSFVQGYEELKSQFLGFCLKRLSQKKSMHSQSEAENFGPWVLHGRSSGLTSRSSGVRHEPYKRSHEQGFSRSGISSSVMSASHSRNSSELNLQGGDTLNIPVPYSNTVPNKTTENSGSPNVHKKQSATPVRRTEHGVKLAVKTEAAIHENCDLDLQKNDNQTNSDTDLNDSQLNPNSLQTGICGSKASSELSQNNQSVSERSTEYTSVDDSMSDSVNEQSSEMSGNEEVSVKAEVNYDTDSDIVIMGVEASKSESPQGSSAEQRLNSLVEVSYGASTSSSHSSGQESFNPMQSNHSDLAAIKKMRRYKDVSCELCGKVLSNFANLQRHLRIHQGLYPYECPVCGKKFTDASNCKKHQIKHLSNSFNSQP